MFDITNADAVKELQKYLLEVSYATHGYPHLAIDGIFGEETRRGVSLFQRRNRLPVTGIVNRRTWQTLYAVYLSAIKTRIPAHKPHAPFQA